MKKKLWTKLILGLMLVAMIATLAACGGNDDVVTPTPDPEETEVSVIDQIVNIIKSVGPLVTTLNNITTSNTLGVDVEAGVNYNFGTDKTGDYSIALAGNIKSTDPEAKLTVQDNNNTDDPNYVLIAYKDGMAYIKQPLTTLNTSVTTGDTTKADLTAIKANINTILEVVMYELASIDFTFDAEALGDSLSAAIGTIDLSEMVTISGNKLTIPAEKAELIIVDILYPMLAKSDDVQSVINTVVNTIFNTTKGFTYIKEDITFPNIYVEASIDNSTLTGINLGIDYTNVNTSGQFAEIYIDLNKFSTESTATITAPSYVTKSLQIGVGAEMDQKDVAADLLLNVTGNMATTTSILVNALLSVDADGSSSTVKGYYNGDNAYFDMASILNMAGITSNNTNGVYSANYNMYEAMTTALNSWKTAAMTTETTTTTGESWSIFQTIYDFLGGDVSALTVTSGVRADPTATQMLTALNNNIGNYLRFTIPTTGYNAALTAVIAQWEANDETVLSILTQDAEWANVANDGVWTGNLVLTKTGANNDLLDVVNLFICNYENNQKVDITVAFLTDFCNKYLALLAISDAASIGDTDEIAIYKNAVKALDDELLFYKNQYLNNTITEAVYKEKVEAHNTALKFENGIGGNATLTANYFANLVMKEIFGYTGTTSDYLADFINSGVTGKVTCVKNGGLNGGIEIWGTTNTTATKYVRIDGYIKVVDMDVSNYSIDISTEAPNVLTDSYATEDVDYRMIATWTDGTKKLNMATSTATELHYMYVAANDQITATEEDALFNKQYPELEILQADLWELLEYYKNLGNVD